jgi:hypothetical protein
LAFFFFRNSITNQDFLGLFHRKDAENAEIIFRFALKTVFKIIKLLIPERGKRQNQSALRGLSVLNTALIYCLQWLFAFKSPQNYHDKPFHIAQDRRNKKSSLSAAICGNRR